MDADAVDPDEVLSAGTADAVDFAVPPGPDHLRILHALEKYHEAVIKCTWRFGRRKYARAVRRKVRYLEILQEELPSEAVARRLVRARRLHQWALRRAYGSNLD